jgi:hypothetical protein
MLATVNVFKDAITKLLLKGYLDVQPGFTTSASSYSDVNTNKRPSVEEVPMKTPSGEVLGLVWHMKGAISRAWVLLLQSIQEWKSALFALQQIM